MFNNDFKQKLPSIFLWLSVFFVAATLLYLLFQISLNRYLTFDEFEHLHASWLVSEGQVPYRDFFEHHHPLLWYLLSPILMVSDDPFVIITASRIVIFVFFILIFYFVYKIAKEIFNKWTGIFTLFSLSSVLMYVQKAIEIRPDVPMTLFWLMSWFCFLKAIKGNILKYYIYSGIFLSIAFLFKQTISIAIFPYIILLLIIWKKEKTIIKHPLLGLSLSFIFPFAIMATVFYIANGLTQYYNLNFIWNTVINNNYHWPFFENIKDYIAFDWFIYVGGVTGIIAMVICWYKKTVIPKTEILIIIFLLIFLLPMIFIVNAPYPHYWMQPFIVFAICTGYLLDCIFRRTNEKFLIKAVAIYITAFVLQNHIANLTYLNLITNDSQLKQIDLVLNITNPQQKIFDYKGESAIFRPHANYYWFITKQMVNSAKDGKIQMDLKDYIVNADVVIASRELIKNTERRNILENQFNRYIGTDIYFKKN